MLVKDEVASRGICPRRQPPVNPSLSTTLQKRGAIDAAKDNIRMKGDGHEMVIRTDSTSADHLKEAGMPLGVEDEWSEQFEFDAEGNINHKDTFSYKR